MPQTFSILTLVLVPTPSISKIKVAFGHKLLYKVRVIFGEISLKLRQTNWDVARNNANIVCL